MAFRVSASPDRPVGVTPRNPEPAGARRGEWLLFVGGKNNFFLFFGSPQPRSCHKMYSPGRQSRVIPALEVATNSPQRLGNATRQSVSNKIKSKTKTTTTPIPVKAVDEIKGDPGQKDNCRLFIFVFVITLFSN